MYTLYELTIQNFDYYVSLADISAGAHLQPDDVKQALERLPLTVKEENSELLYRLDEAFCHVPVLLTFLFKFK